ncbi:MAG: hypothetical protein ABIT05_06065 [Chitinophagaceae bacterium]
MKRNLITSLLFLWTVTCFAQKDLSGTYSYAFKPEGNPPKEAVDAGRSGKLVLLKIDDNKYRFWLDVGAGWPSYILGETDGTLSFVNDTASFDNTFEGASNPCILKFRYNEGTIIINGFSTSYDCGFGNGVNADGDYAWLKKQPALNYQWLRKEYPEAPTIVITNDKAELFRDESLLYPFTPGQYCSKGESMLGIIQTEKAVYTEYFSSSGKFIYGWLKKSAVKFGKPE